MNDDDHNVQIIMWGLLAMGGVALFCLLLAYAAGMP